MEEKKKSKFKKGLEYTGWTLLTGLGITAGSFLVGFGYRVGCKLGRKILR